jgi:hypothetical protein
MALTSKQRSKLPPSAFAYPATRSYPVPTKLQAAKAGISETQRLGLHRNALSRAAQPGTSGNYTHVARKVRARTGGQVLSVHPTKGTLSPPKRKR